MEKENKPNKSLTKRMSGRVNWTCDTRPHLKLALLPLHFSKPMKRFSKIYRYKTKNKIKKISHRLTPPHLVSPVHILNLVIQIQETVKNHTLAEV